MGVTKLKYEVVMKIYMTKNNTGARATRALLILALAGNLIPNQGVWAVEAAGGSEEEFAVVSLPKQLTSVRTVEQKVIDWLKSEENKVYFQNMANEFTGSDIERLKKVNDRSVFQDNVFTKAGQEANSLQAISKFALEATTPWERIKAAIDGTGYPTTLTGLFGADIKFKDSFLTPLLADKINTAIGKIEDTDTLGVAMGQGDGAKNAGNVLDEAWLDGKIKMACGDAINNAMTGDGLKKALADVVADKIIAGGDKKYFKVVAGGDLEWNDAAGTQVDALTVTDLEKLETQIEGLTAARGQLSVEDLLGATGLNAIKDVETAKDVDDEAAKVFLDTAAAGPVSAFVEAKKAAIAATAKKSEVEPKIAELKKIAQWLTDGAGGGGAGDRKEADLIQLLTNALKTAHAANFDNAGDESKRIEGVMTQASAAAQADQAAQAALAFLEEQNHGDTKALFEQIMSALVSGQRKMSSGMAISVRNTIKELLLSKTAELIGDSDTVLFADGAAKTEADKVIAAINKLSKGNKTAVAINTAIDTFQQNCAAALTAKTNEVDTTLNTLKSATTAAGQGQGQPVQGSVPLAHFAPTAKLDHASQNLKNAILNAANAAVDAVVAATPLSAKLKAQFPEPALANGQQQAQVSFLEASLLGKIREGLKAKPLNALGTLGLSAAAIKTAITDEIVKKSTNVLVADDDDTDTVKISGTDADSVTAQALDKVWKDAKLATVLKEGVGAEKDLVTLLKLNKGDTEHDEKRLGDILNSSPEEVQTANAGAGKAMNTLLEAAKKEATAILLMLQPDQMVNGLGDLKKASLFLLVLKKMMDDKGGFYFDEDSDAFLKKGSAIEADNQLESIFTPLGSSSGPDAYANENFWTFLQKQFEKLDVYSYPGNDVSDALKFYISKQEMSIRAHEVQRMAEENRTREASRTTATNRGGSTSATPVSFPATTNVYNSTGMTKEDMARVVADQLKAGLEEYWAKNGQKQQQTESIQTQGQSNAVGGGNNEQIAEPNKIKTFEQLKNIEKEVQKKARLFATQQNKTRARADRIVLSQYIPAYLASEDMEAKSYLGILNALNDQIKGNPALLNSVRRAQRKTYTDLLKKMLTPPSKSRSLRGRNNLPDETKSQNTNTGNQDDQGGVAFASSLSKLLKQLGLKENTKISMSSRLKNAERDIVKKAKDALRKYSKENKSSGVKIPVNQHMSYYAGTETGKEVIKLLTELKNTLNGAKLVKGVRTADIKGIDRLLEKMDASKFSVKPGNTNLQDTKKALAAEKRAAAKKAREDKIALEKAKKDAAKKAREDKKAEKDATNKALKDKIALEKGDRKKLLETKKAEKDAAKKLLEAKKAEKDAQNKALAAEKRAAAKKVREDKIALEKAKKDAAKNAGVTLAIGG
jgi:hypothetical protein